MTLYLGNNLISGVATPTEPTRNLGQIIESILPITDAGLHLLDGSKILGGGIYNDFVTKIGEIYDAQPKYSNVTKVGSIADSDSVLSGFSASNYAKLPTIFNPTSNTWEMVIKVKTGSDLGTSSWITGGTVTSGLDWQVPTIGYEGTHKPTMYLSSNGSSWDIAQNIQGTTDLQTNTDYWYKLEFTGSAYNLYLSTDGTTYGLEATVTSSTSIYNASSLMGLGCNFYSSANTTYWRGSIDLNESYINIDGFRWWTGRMASGFTEENAWQSSVNAYGVCGKFVYDSVANTVRLPKITGMLEGTTDVTALGDLIEQYVRLPNITGYVGGNNLTTTESGYSGGALYYGTGSYVGPNVSGTYYGPEVRIDASRSSSVYSGDGTNTKIQPQAIKVLYYIVIATATKTDIEVDIDQVTTDLNGKADVDLSNMNASQSAKDTIIDWSGVETAGQIGIGTPSSSSPYVLPSAGYIIWVSYYNGSIADRYMYYQTPNFSSYRGLHVAVGYEFTYLLPLMPKGSKVYAGTNTSAMYFAPVKGDY